MTALNVSLLPFFEPCPKTELHYFKKLGNDFLALSSDDIKQLIENMSLFKIEVEE